MKVMQLLLKNNLKLAADVRALQSATFRTCLIPSTASFVVKAKEASQKYNELVQAAGKNREYGPPHVHVWAAIAAEAAVHMSGDARAVLDRHISEIDSPDKLLQDVLYCRVAPAYGGKHVKIYLTTTEKLRPVADVFSKPSKLSKAKRNLGKPQKVAWNVSYKHFWKKSRVSSAKQCDDRRCECLHPIIWGYPRFSGVVPFGCFCFALLCLLHTRLPPCELH